MSIKYIFSFNLVFHCIIYPCALNFYKVSWFSPRLLSKLSYLVSDVKKRGLPKICKKVVFLFGKYWKTSTWTLCLSKLVLRVIMKKVWGQKNIVHTLIIIQLRGIILTLDQTLVFPYNCHPRSYPSITHRKSYIF